jgi:hypothetical protein
VVPLGSPYGPGRWVESSTGSAGRPLVNGSWDAWAYGPYSFGIYDLQSGEPVPAVPEPGSLVLLSAGVVLILARRKS